MELPVSLENKTYSLVINHRSALYNFKTVGINFEMKSTMFSYLNNDQSFIIKKKLINEKLIKFVVTEYEKKDNVNLDVIRKKRRILQRIFDKNNAGIVLAETDDSADENNLEIQAF